jgi:hypothetical protein
VRRSTPVGTVGAQDRGRDEPLSRAGFGDLCLGTSRAGLQKILDPNTNFARWQKFSCALLSRMRGRAVLLALEI